MTALIGVVMLAASVGALWFMLPKGDKLNPLATMPFVESLIPLGIVSGLALGITFTLSGLMQ
jgi:hypothetical protein